MTKETKEALRRQLLGRLHKQPEKLRLSRSTRITGRVRRLPLYKRAKTILCYVAIRGEVETRPLLERALAEGKRVAVPVTVGRGHRIVAAEILDVRKDLAKKGRFGVPTPPNPAKRQIPMDQLDLMIVPGIGFDREGRRLGRGSGHFDRLLARVPLQVPRIGIAFQFQVVPEVPAEPHDQPVLRVVTDGK